MIETATLITLGVWLLDKIKDKGFDVLQSKLLESDLINDKFQNAVKITSSKLQKKYPDILAGRIDFFFKTEPVFKELVKLIFKNSVVNLETISNSFDTDTLPKDFIVEFVNELKNELLKDRELEKIISDKELFILIYGIANDIDLMARNSTLTLSEIVEIKNIIEQRIEQKFIFSEFLQKYSENAINNLSQVNFIGLGVDISIKRKRKKLEDVFVKPNFRLINVFFKENEHEDSPFFDERDEQLNYRKLFNHSDKVVILGNPGSGKSILVKSIICNILSGKKEEFDNKNIEKSLPFRIELRKYLVYKKQNRGNILKYLNSLLEEEYSIFNMTEMILDGILKGNSNIIFFDGLDEIFKIEDKIEIKNDIENFHNSYPLTKSLTTSRIIGYDEAKLNDSEFCELNILNFNEGQIEEYLQKWYAKEEENQEIREKEIEGFLGKMHEIDDELVSNPLLLSLIVIIYRNTLKLPESKLEIYQSCTKTLVEKWDASKGLEINLDPAIYKNKEKILADLAYWQYEQLSGEKISITFDKALKTVASTLEDKLKIDDADSFSLAESFMEYAQKRSIYFDNNFTHKTFLEYYTAYWIYSNIEKKHKTQERNILISKYIDNPFWHIVLELLLNMIDKDQADSEIMDELMNLQVETDKKALPFILSTISSFKNISIECLVMVIHEAIDFVLNNCVQENLRRNEETLQSKIYDAVKDLFNSDQQIKKIIISKIIEIEIESKNLDLSDLNYILYIEMTTFNFFREDEGPFIFELSNEDFFKERINNNKYLFQLNSTFFNYDKEKYFELTEYFVNKFGVVELFNETGSLFDRIGFGSFFMFYLRIQIESINIIDLNKNLKKLFDLGLNVNDLIAYLIKDEFYFGHEDVLIKRLVDKYDAEEDMIISMILLILIFKIQDSRYGMSKLKIKSLAKNRRKEDVLMTIDSIEPEKRFEEIIEMHKI